MKIIEGGSRLRILPVLWLCAAFTGALFPILTAAGLDPVSDPEVSFFLDRSSARPGETAELVLSVQTNVPLKGLAFAVDFDESKVRVLEVRRLPPPTDGVPTDPVQVPADLALTTVSNLDQEKGNQLNEGWLYAELNAIDAGAKLPVAQNTAIPILKILFLVLPKAAPGFTPVDFRNVGPVETLPSTFLINSVEMAGVGVLDTKAPTAVQSGGIDIIGEVGFFMRGDANFDGARDISDPILDLSYLFLGGRDLPCADAADANDDGLIDVSDAIFILARLFEGGGPFPEPRIWGEDPTADGLGCAVYPGK